MSPRAVFAELARGAAKLAVHPALNGWLYTCVRRMTANALRAEQRRKDRDNYIARYSETGRRFCLVSFHLKATTDAEGKFSFDKVPPGQCQIFRQEIRSLSGALSGFESHETTAAIKAGTDTEVVLGGTGRTIVGKAVLSRTTTPVDWQGVPVRVTLKTGDEPGPRPKRDDFSSTEAFIKAQDHFFAAYDAKRHFGAFCDSDGSFRVRCHQIIVQGTTDLRLGFQRLGSFHLTMKQRRD